jgi:transcriptional regulator with XRE-family HTH domain
MVWWFLSTTAGKKNSQSLLGLQFKNGAQGLDVARPELGLVVDISVKALSGDAHLLCDVALFQSAVGNGLLQFRGVCHPLFTSFLVVVNHHQAPLYSRGCALSICFYKKIKKIFHFCVVFYPPRCYNVTKEVITMTIGQRIKARRQELKLTQRELAARLGYNDHTTLTRIEADKVDLPQSRIEKIAEVLDVSIGYLMGWAEQPEDLGALAATVLKDPALLKIVQNCVKLDEDDLATVAALVASLAEKKKS